MGTDYAFFLMSERKIPFRIISHVNHAEGLVPIHLKTAGFKNYLIVQFYNHYGSVMISIFTGRISLVVLLSFLLLLSANRRVVAKYPEKPIIIINSNKPGGAIDLMTRKMAMIAKKYDDVTILVENVPGGSGAAATG